MSTSTTPAEPSGNTVLANLIWLQKTREQRLAEARRLADGRRNR